MQMNQPRQIKLYALFMGLSVIAASIAARSASGQVVRGIMTVTGAEMH